MTAVVTFVFFFLIAAHYATIGPFLAEGWTIYETAFKIVTSVAATFCILSGLKNVDWRKIAAGCCIILYAILAPKVYNYEQAIILSMLLDLLVASYFIVLGRRRWELAAGLVFTVAVGVSAFTAIGWIPSHLDRPWPQFLAWSQGDITAILGYCAMIIIGLGAGDGGMRIYHWLAGIPVAFVRRDRLVSRLAGVGKAQKAA